MEEKMELLYLPFASGRLRSFLSAVLLICLSAVFVACRDGSDSTGNGSNGKYAVILDPIKISIDDPNAPQRSASGVAPAAKGTHGDIAAIKISVKDGTADVIADQALTKTGNKWETTLIGVPGGINLTFIVQAYNSSDVVIFSGTTTQTLREVGGVVPTVTITLEVADDGETLTFPRITRIEKQEPVYINIATPVRFSVQGNTNETLGYCIARDPSNDASGDRFDPDSGAIGLAGSAGTVVSHYTAPVAGGSYRYAFRLTNSQKNYVETDFSMHVKQSVDRTAIVVQINPVVEALGIKRVDSRLIWTADVTDDAPTDQLRYSWKFNGSTADFVDHTANPAVLTGYTDDTTGDLTLTVTDRNGTGGSTTVSYRLPANQFLPDTMPPVLESYSPGEGAKDVSVDGGQIVLRFNEAVVLDGLTVADTTGDACGGKTFQLSKAADGFSTCVKLNTPTGNGSRTVSVGVGETLQAGTRYKIKLLAGAVKDPAGNATAGYASATGFETRDDSEWIVFSSDRGGNYNLYTMLADGTDITRLTTHSNDEVQPIWSPDGTKIVYRRSSSSNFQIRMMDSDGGNDRAISNYSSGDGPSGWLPDGSHILIVTMHRHCERYTIDKIKLDGIGKTLFLDPTWAEGDKNLSSISFNRAGDRVIWASQKNGCWSPTFELYTAPFADGAIDRNSIRKITNDPNHVNEATFSGNGDYIAYMRSDAARGYNLPCNIYVMELASKKRTKLTNAENDFFYNQPKWSKDSGSIYFVTNISGSHNIWRMDADGSNKINITNSSYNNSNIDIRY